MKKVLIFMMLMAASVSMAQIKKVDVAKEDKEEIGKITPAGKLAIKCDRIGDTYSFSYYEAANKSNEVKFNVKNVDNAFASLYEMVSDGFTNMPKDPVLIELPDGYLWLSYRRFQSAVVMKLAFSAAKEKDVAKLPYSQEFNKQQINKLFGIK